MAWLWVLFGTGMVALILYSDTVKKPKIEWIAKPCASLGFLMLGWLYAPFQSTYGTWIFSGLLLSVLGDVFLIRPKNSGFLLGLSSFLIAHICYTIAFWAALGGFPQMVVLLAVSIVSLGIFGNLKNHLNTMAVPVMLYMCVISLMVTCAFSAALNLGSTQNVLACVGAVLFFGSDISVAWLKFMAPSIVHRYWGIPMYYVGQYLIAYSVGV